MTTRSRCLGEGYQAVGEAEKEAGGGVIGRAMGGGDTRSHRVPVQEN